MTMDLTELVDEHYEPGTRVEVRRRFDGSWTRGFEVAETSVEGVRVRRLSDNSVLPVEFSWNDVRREKKKQGLWWY
jgi:hypothetical protein